MSCSPVRSCYILPLLALLGIGCAPTPEDPVSLRDLDEAYREALPQNLPDAPVGGRLRVQVGAGRLVQVTAEDLTLVLAAEEDRTGAPEDVCLAWLSEWGVLFDVGTPAQELTLDVVRPSNRGTRVDFAQTHPGDGTPVFGARIRCSFNSAGHLRQVGGHATDVSETQSPSSVASITVEEAQQIGFEYLQPEETEVSEATLGTLLLPNGEAHSTFQLFLAGFGGARAVYIDATNGELVHERSLSPNAMHREIRWLNYTVPIPSAPPGLLIREVGPGIDFFEGTWQGTSQEADDATLATDTYLRGQFGRDGWDDSSTDPRHRMRVLTDASMSSTNAQWSSTQPILGETSSSVFLGDQAACLDVIAHEWVHGVQEDEGMAWAMGAVGAAGGESTGDIFGELAENYITGSADWMVATGGTCPAPVRDLTSPESPGCSGCSTAPVNFANRGRWLDSPLSSDTYYSDSHILTHAAYLMSRDPMAAPITQSGIEVGGIGPDLDQIMYDLVTFWIDGSEDWTSLASDWKDSIASNLGSPAVNPAAREGLDAVDSAGLWTGSFLWWPPRTEDRMAIAQHGGDDAPLTYIFWRSSGSDTVPAGELHLRGYPCNFASADNSCFATLEMTVGNTEAGPGAAVLGDELYVFYSNIDDGNQITYRTFDLMGNPSAPVLLGGVSKDDVTAVVHAGSLYVFWRDVTSNNIRYQHLTGGAWSGEKVVPDSTGASSGPAATELNGRLHLFFARSTPAPDNLFYVFSDELDVWSGTTRPPNQQGTSVTGSPSAAVFQNRIQIAALTENGRLRYASLCRETDGCTYRPDEWTWTNEYQRNALGEPTLYSDGGLSALGYGPYLYLIWPTDSLVNATTEGDPIPLAEPILTWDYRLSE